MPNLGAMEKRPVPRWTFGDRVRKARRELRLSQAALADQLGAALGSPLSTQTVGSWESGMNSPSDIVETSRALQEITGIPAEWFLGLMSNE